MNGFGTVRPLAGAGDSIGTIVHSLCERSLTAHSAQVSGGGIWENPIIIDGIFLFPDRAGC